MKAMRNDDFNTILELKMRGYQPSENTLKSLQPDISSTTFIAAVKIFQMEGVLKSLQDIKSAQSPITSGNKRNMEQTNLLFNFQFFFYFYTTVRHKITKKLIPISIHNQ